MSRFTIVQLEILLHLAYVPTKIDAPQSRARKQGIDRWKFLDMVDVMVDGGEQYLRVTEKGHVFIEELCNTPEPIAVTSWEVHRETT